MIEEFAEGNEYQVFVFESENRPVSLAGIRNQIQNNR